MTWFCAAILGQVAAAFDQRLVVVGLVPNCNLFDDFLVELDDKTRKRLCQHLQEVPVGVLVGGPVSRIYDGTGQVVQNTKGDLEGQQHDDGEPVEHVVDSGRSEGPPELVPLCALHQ
uniref:Putative secreted protein n=1 Tax=Ixodes ricinus TaxID=34613 RepID=A0A6B0UMG1_IXORI